MNPLERVKDNQVGLVILADLDQFVHPVRVIQLHALAAHPADAVHIYGFNLLPEKVEVLLDGFLEVDQALIKDLKKFLDGAKDKAVEEITRGSDP
ncbi:hypothetical protein GFC01_16160 [Desulfofundulus thermobenzoicus]|uniref:Uncharacterized protein n=1 Tax=Desulfofundulus thermobenzoicus TaxID=29376 RepID=A0A6N7IVZ1_9FIRM|nr:hypothetical protein [Desulfofundulus thermobenzoicus]MQL53763.1 hypothetical protein [Desulfofundulus thermobenzoicus]